MRQLNFSRTAILAGTIAVTAALTACAPHRSPASYPGYSSYPEGSAYPAQAMGTEYGQVTNIEMFQGSQRGQTTGAGAVIGAVVGGVLGNQIGGGSGRAAATALGAVGGAVAGNAIEGRNNEAGAVYRISIRLDQGGHRAYEVGSIGDLRVGDRVRLYNGQISRY